MYVCMYVCMYVETNYPTPALPTSSQGGECFLPCKNAKRRWSPGKSAPGPLFKSKTGPGTHLDPSKDDPKVAANTAPTAKAITCRERVVTFFGTWH